MHEINSFLQNSAIVFLVITLLITLLSLIRFSSILIKLVALEIITNLLIGAIALWSLYQKQPLYIDICIALALIMFLGTIAYCQFLLKRGHHDD